jgi:hypothetical protein
MNDGMKAHENRGTLDLFDHIDDFIYDMHISETLKAFQAKFDENLYYEHRKSLSAVSIDSSLSDDEKRNQIHSLELNYLTKFMDADVRQDFTILQGHLQHLWVRYRIMRTIEKFDSRVRSALIASIAVVFAKVRPKNYNEKIIGECIKTSSPYYGNAAMRKTIDSFAGGTVYPRHIILMNVMNMPAGKGIGGALSHEIAHLLSDEIDNVPHAGEEKSILVYSNVLNQTPSVPILTKEMLRNLAQAYFVSQ